MADTSNRGFASVDEGKQRRIASEGGKSSGGSFEEGSTRARKAGKRGASSQPTEAKRKGGQRSSRS